MKRSRTHDIPRCIRSRRPSMWYPKPLVVMSVCLPYNQNSSPFSLTSCSSLLPRFLPQDNPLCCAFSQAGLRTAVSGCTVCFVVSISHNKISRLGKKKPILGRKNAEDEKSRKLKEMQGRLTQLPRSPLSTTTAQSPTKH